MCRTMLSIWNHPQAIWTTINNIIKCQLIKLILSESKQITRNINTHQNASVHVNAESVAMLAANGKR